MATGRNTEKERERGVTAIVNGMDTEREREGGG